RLRGAIAALERPDGYLSASFGVAEHRRGENIMVLLDRADQALLRAKHSGRNRVCAEHAPPGEALQLMSEAARTEGGAVARRQRWDNYYL
ncbi:GGDEF-domain containing protein, partial [Pseudomonas sp. FW301-21B01]|uniref:diguanylate cyclase domain-containing protein n=1 Tax=Pseudomonas sp. FW301-21B01 TaxID=2070624 RepID=UPI000CA84F42